MVCVFLEHFSARFFAAVSFGFSFFSLFCFSFSTWLKFSSSFCRLLLCVLSPSAFVLLAFASKFSFSFGQFFHSRRRCRFFSVVAVVVIWVSLADAVAYAIVVIVVVLVRVVVLNQISIILFVAIFITFRFHSRLSACNKAQSESLARRKNERKRENRRKSEKKVENGKLLIIHTHTNTHKHSNTQNRNRERDQHTVPQCGAAIVRTLNYGAGNPCGPFSSSLPSLSCCHRHCCCCPHFVALFRDALNDIKLL